LNIYESTEIKQVQVAKLSGFLRNYLSKFQEVLAFLPLKPLNRTEVQELKQQLEPYAKYSFAKSLWQGIIQYQNKPKTNNVNLSSFEEIKALFLNHQYNEAHAAASYLRDEIVTYLSGKTLEAKPFSKLSGVLKNPMHMIFSGGQRTGLMSNLDKDTIENVINVDLTQFQYTYLYPKQTQDGLELPEATNEIEYLCYLILQLKDSPKPVRLNSTQFEIYSRIMSSRFNKLRELVQHYIFSNNKKDIEKIKQLTTPEIRQAIVKSIQGVRYVYRGLGVDKETPKEQIIQQDRETQYISTSPHESVAERFARGIGHLQSEKETKHSEAAIVVYDISHRDCVVFSTSIFGEAFGESDILIDATKAEVVSVDRKFFHIPEKEYR
jgi:hypothetical protein